MVRTFQKKNSLKNLSLSMALLQKSLTNRFDDFLRIFEVVSSDLAITRNCNIPPSINPSKHICKALSLTGHEVKPSDLQACHRLKKKESFFVKFKWRKLKQKVFVNRKNLRNKPEDLRQLTFSSKFFISENMCYENHQLAYKCRQLKIAGKIHPHLVLE